MSSLNYSEATDVVGRVAGESLAADEFSTPLTPDRAYYERAATAVLDRVEQNLDTFRDTYPGPASHDLVYPETPNRQTVHPEVGDTSWTPSFWTGMLWLSSELSDADQFADVASHQVEDFVYRISESIDVDLSSLGWLYLLSCVAAHRLTGDERARSAAMAAADRLGGLFLEPAGVIPAAAGREDTDAVEEVFPDYLDPAGTFIIDTLMNIRLLYWSARTGGPERHRELAETHARNAADHLVRPDGSTFQAAYLDPETGERQNRGTIQGVSDDSTWARGQAWAIYGFATSYGSTGDWRFADLSCKAANYYLNTLPADLVPPWDLDLDADADRDSSAAAIAAAGLLELAGHLPPADEHRRHYENAALRTLKSLHEEYTLFDHPESNGVLDHGMFHKHGGWGVDECCIWGDYHYLEALTRVLTDWDTYW